MREARANDNYRCTGGPAETSCVSGATASLVANAFQWSHSPFEPILVPGVPDSRARQDRVLGGRVVFEDHVDNVIRNHRPQAKLDTVLELALDDDYFVKRKLYPNVDFYSGIMYQAMGFKPEIFTVLFAIPRTGGWLAQWQEMITDPEQKIARPRHVYTAEASRDVVPIEKRVDSATRAMA